MNFLTWPLRHRQVVFVLSFFALALGLNSLLTMPRQATPTISVFFFVKLAEASRNSQASLVHPEVFALGKKKTTTFLPRSFES